MSFLQGIEQRKQIKGGEPKRLGSGIKYFHKEIPDLSCQLPAL